MNRKTQWLFEAPFNLASSYLDLESLEADAMSRNAPSPVDEADNKLNVARQLLATETNLLNVAEQNLINAKKKEEERPSFSSYMIARAALQVETDQNKRQSYQNTVNLYEAYQATIDMLTQKVKDIKKSHKEAKDYYETALKEFNQAKQAAETAKQAAAERAKAAEKAAKNTQKAASHKSAKATKKKGKNKEYELDQVGLTNQDSRKREYLFEILSVENFDLSETPANDVERNDRKMKLQTARQQLIVAQSNLNVLRNTIDNKKRNDARRKVNNALLTARSNIQDAKNVNGKGTSVMNLLGIESKIKMAIDTFNKGNFVQTQNHLSSIIPQMNI